eukprot:gene15882-7214_t
MRDRLDGTYTKMLRSVLGVSWKDHKTNKQLYGNLSKVSTVLQKRRLRFVGHCWRRKDELIYKLLLWQPTHGKQKPGRPCITYMDQLLNDTGLDCTNINRVMENREEWKKLVKDSMPITIDLNSIVIKIKLTLNEAGKFSIDPVNLGSLEDFRKNTVRKMGKSSNSKQRKLATTRTVQSGTSAEGRIVLPSEAAESANDNFRQSRRTRRLVLYEAKY